MLRNTHQTTHAQFCFGHTHVHALKHIVQSIHKWPCTEKHACSTCTVHTVLYTHKYGVIYSCPKLDACTLHGRSKGTPICEIQMQYLLPNETTVIENRVCGKWYSMHAHVYVLYLSCASSHMGDGCITNMHIYPSALWEVIEAASTSWIMDMYYLSAKEYVSKKKMSSFWFHVDFKSLLRKQRDPNCTLLNLERNLAWNFY